PASTSVTHTLPLHDALPISLPPGIGHIRFAGSMPRRDAAYELALEKPCSVITRVRRRADEREARACPGGAEVRKGRSSQNAAGRDRKSTRLHSSHVKTSYAV